MSSKTPEQEPTSPTAKWMGFSESDKKGTWVIWLLPVRPGPWTRPYCAPQPQFDHQSVSYRTTAKGPARKEDYLKDSLDYQA